MSSGGSQTQTTQTNSQNVNLPFAPLQPYLQQGMAEAARLYAQGPAQYTPFSQVASMTQPQRQAIEATKAYVNNPQLQQTMGMGQQAVMNLINPNQNPFAPMSQQAQQTIANRMGQNQLYDPAQAINRMMTASTQSPDVLNPLIQSFQATDPYTRQLASRLQRPEISQAVARAQEPLVRSQMTSNILSQVFDQQQKQKLDAARLAESVSQERTNLANDLLGNQLRYGTQATGLGLQFAPQMLNMPISMLGALNTVGGMEQQQAQAQLADAVNRWNFAQAAPFDQLVKFRNMITSSTRPEWGVTNTQGSQTVTVPTGGGLGTSLGTLAGMGLGALLAPATGGMSMLAAASLGGSLGGTAGGLLGR